MNFKKGFTLIELLVVVAIIGILASVVLASLNTARAKGSDAAAIASLDNMRAEAAIYYDNTSQTYGTASTTCTAGMFSTDTTMAAAITQATGNATAISCNSTASTYAMAVTLKSGYGYYCVDSSGVGTKKTLASLTGGLSGVDSTFAINTTKGLCTP